MMGLYFQPRVIASVLVMLTCAHHSLAAPQVINTPQNANGTQDVSLVMPGEQTLHNGTLMAFPTYESIGDWELAVGARAEIAAIANIISHFEPVWLYCQPENYAVARSYLANSTTQCGEYAIELRDAKFDQLWIRDFGPIFANRVNKADNHTVGKVALDFNFNVWGEKFPSFLERYFTSVYSSRDYPFVQTETSTITTEGGAIDIDGEGTLLATESSIINDNRNPNVTKDQIDGELKSKLGVGKIIWLPGLKGYDVTDDHTDAFARFMKPGIVMVSQPPENAAANVTARYEQAVQILRNSTDNKGRTLDIRTLVEPDQRALGYPEPGQTPFKSVTSYVNVYFPHGAVVIAKFGDDRTDSAAKELFEKTFEDREVVQVDIKALAIIGGGIHCSTQQVPV